MHLHIGTYSRFIKVLVEWTLKCKNYHFLLLVFFLPSLFLIDALMVTILMRTSLRRKCKDFLNDATEIWVWPPHFCTENFCCFETAAKNLESYPEIFSNSFPILKLLEKCLQDSFGQFLVQKEHFKPQKIMFCCYGIHPQI